MIDEHLKYQLDSAITSGDGSCLKILLEFKSNGGKQRDALDTLEAMRRDASEKYEDQILEIMDFASGFCSPQNIVWP